MLALAVGSGLVTINNSNNGFNVRGQLKVSILGLNVWPCNTSELKEAAVQSRYTAVLNHVKRSVAVIGVFPDAGWTNLELKPEL